MPVTVVTLNTSLVRGTTAKFNGNLTDMNGQAAIDCYFQYKITGAGSWSDTSANKEELTAVGEFSYSITGLTENESYDVRAVAEWTDGTLQNAYGSTETFNAFWVREGSQEDFERGILGGAGIRLTDEMKLKTDGLSFDGVDDYVSRASVFKLNTVDYTAEVFMKGHGLFCTTERTSTSRGNVRNSVSDTGVLSISINYSGSSPWWRFATSTIKATDLTEINYFAVSWDKTTDEVVFYINDLVETASLSNTIDATDGNFSNIEIGRYRNHTYSVFYSEITVAEFRLWNIIRTPVQIEVNRFKYLAGTESGLQIYYKVDEGAGASLTDSSGNSRTGTITGATWTGVTSSGNRQKPYKITNTDSEITWTATTPTDTTLAIEAQVQGTTAITDEAVGTGDGVETVFYLDHWPANTPIVTVNAVAETGFTLGDDRRTIIFDTAPADTHAILASYTAVDDPQEDEVEIQTLDLDSPAGGTFKLGDGTTWTADIAYDATPATIQTALEGLYGAGNVSVYDKVVFNQVGGTSWKTLPGLTNGKLLLVAGGGGGGGNSGAGGGAGELIWDNNFNFIPGQIISVQIGDGGDANTLANGTRFDGDYGGDSTFGSLVAKGGGGGCAGGSGPTSQNGRDGGSGGGAACYGSGKSGTGGASTASVDGDGNKGGNAASNSNHFRNAGGGGAGGAGPDIAAGSSNAGTVGGAGIDLSAELGTDVGDEGIFASGGSACFAVGSTPGGGGEENVNGQDNTGGGGGGRSGKGGSGVAIVKFPNIYIEFDFSVGNSGLVADFTGLT